MYFVCCGVSRLARYNVTAESLSEGGDKVKYFEGTPIPTSLLLSAVLAWAAWQRRIGADLSRRRLDLPRRLACIRWRCCSRSRGR